MDYTNFLVIKNFQKKFEKVKLRKLLNNLKKEKKIIGYGASAKAVTVLNYCNLKENYFDYFYDTLKQKLENFCLEPR